MRATKKQDDVPNYEGHSRPRIKILHSLSHRKRARLMSRLQEELGNTTTLSKAGSLDSRPWQRLHVLLGLVESLKLLSICFCPTPCFHSHYRCRETLVYWYGLVTVSVGYSLERCIYFRFTSGEECPNSILMVVAFVIFANHCCRLTHFAGLF